MDRGLRIPSLEGWIARAEGDARDGVGYGFSMSTTGGHAQEPESPLSAKHFFRLLRPLPLASVHQTQPHPLTPDS